MTGEDILKLARAALDVGLCFDMTAHITRSTDAEILAFANALLEKERAEAWTDPNDKAQARYLPNIGERVLFSYKGRVHYGAHTGGGFKSGSHHYNTWACRWMPLPAAPQQ